MGSVRGDDGVHANNSDEPIRVLGCTFLFLIRSPILKGIREIGWLDSRHIAFTLLDGKSLLG